MRVIRSLCGGLSLGALLVGTDASPACASVQCVDKSVVVCRHRESTPHAPARDIASKEVRRQVGRDAAPNPRRNQNARVRSYSTSCDSPPNSGPKAPGTASVKNCFRGVAIAGSKPSDEPSLTLIAPPILNPQRAGIGTAFSINAAGEFLTSYHVLRACAGAPQVRISGEWQGSDAIAIDETNDLAVIRAGSSTSVPALRFRDGKGIRPADPVVVLGFPYAGLLTKSPQITTGVVSALSGIRDDPRHIQLTAPVQPGSSGGPLLDLSGNVVAIVSAKLNNVAAAEWTGMLELAANLPEGINFAIKSAKAREFLEAHRVQYDTGESTNKLDAADVGELATKSVVMVRCKASD